MNGVPFDIVPRAEAAELLRQQKLAEEHRREQTGQEAGIPGMGPEPPRVHQPGGDLLLGLQHPAWTVFEEDYNIAPDESWFNPDVTPQRPVQFELGAYQVPPGLHYWLFDYNFQPYRFSGSDPGDLVPLEEGRLFTVLGYDITVDQRRSSHLLFQLDPVPAPVDRQSFVQNPNAANTRPVANQQAFNNASFAAFAAAAGPASSLLPQRLLRQGAQSAPFTIIVKESQHVALSCVIFRPVPIPLGSILGRHAGFLIPSQVSESLVNRMRPR